MKAAKNRSRREFIRDSALIAGAPMILPSSVLGLNGKTPPSERIVLGGIGLGPRGREVLTGFLKQDDVQFVAIADAQVERANIIKRIVERKYGHKDCSTHQDMSDVLSRDDIDAVIIATGDRWHTTASVYAARAGKDIYCEKPCSMNIQESIELDEEVTKHERIFQAGTQRRNVPNFALAAELAQSGKLGSLTAVHAGILALREYRSPYPAQSTPDPSVTDWDKWVGPAPNLPYNQRYCRGGWRGHKGLYAAYYLPEWGAHTIDLCQWAAGMDGTTPVEYEAIDDTTIHAKYANGVKLVMRLAGFKGEGDWSEGLGTCPVRFEGENGWVEAGDNKKIVASEPTLVEGKKVDRLAGTNPHDHVRNFLDCVKTREQPSCNSTVARYGHLACFAAAASWKSGRKVTFDPQNPILPDHDESNSLQSYTRRAPYTI
ncbi:gfo/Idh/MocA family oxidoreductase [Coraliomargarita sinensis]|uniref:Gfo/Idh/MocA family oxidoreductase n=1 Tax=Coraliomargarita sinensis TaxID=2174842 RepID=A0A317ZHB7_9BACT|nr:Gfo/Idh/MocA family oxidoreductase [Coraliomargarita sinensis]PXA03368.1 gfo/Idh/MocA family oxidoreductase [Coraliomargarita sinensis]